MDKEWGLWQAVTTLGLAAASISLIAVPLYIAMYRIQQDEIAAIKAGLCQQIAVVRGDYGDNLLTTKVIWTTCPAVR